MFMNEKEFVKSLEEVSDAFKHASSLLDSLLSNFSEERLERACSIPYSEDDYGMAISEYATYSGNCSRSIKEIVSAMKIDGLLEE